MKKNMCHSFLVIGLIAVLGPLSSVRAATNVYLNFTWQQMNSNIARVAASAATWDAAYSWGSHTGLYPSVNAWYATNAAQNAINTNFAALIAAIPTNISVSGLVSNSTFIAYTNTQHGVNTNLAALIAAIPTNVTVSGLVSNSTFIAYTNIQHQVNTNLAGLIAAIPTNSTGTGSASSASWLSTVVVAGAGSAAINGVYTNTATTVGTNAVFRSSAFDIWYSDGFWVINSVSNRVYENAHYYLNVSGAQSPIVSGSWTVDLLGTNPAPTCVLVAYSTTDVFLQDVGTKVLAGKTTNFTFMSDSVTTGRLWFTSGILTNLDLNIGD